VELSAQEAHYLTRVLRLAPGARIEVFDSAGRHGRGVLGGSAAAPVVTDLQWSLPEQSEGTRVELWCGLMRGHRWDWLLEKATELGATTIQPLLCARSVVRVDDDRAADKAARWQGIAASAAQQCGAPRAPSILPPRPISALESPVCGGSTGAWVLDPRATKALPQALLQGPPPSRIVVATGVEGGFTDVELQRLAALGFEAASLGPRILRAETAPLAALAVIMALVEGA
jgi:16S rRNA (uracil1498-N3)-methyltransferase